MAKWSFDSRITCEFTKDEKGSHPLTNNGARTGAPRTASDTANAVFGNTSMTVNNAAFRATSISIATWFKITGSTPFHTLASVRVQNSGAPFNSYNLNIRTSTSSKLTFLLSTSQINDAQVQNTVSTSSNVWTHAAVTCDYISSEDSTAVKMYVNSALVAQTKVKSFIIYNSSNPLVLGSVVGAPNGNSLQVSLDEFLYYNRVLTPSEVATIYNGTATGIHSFNNNQNKEITLYPNPTSSFLNIEVKEQTQVSIINVLDDVVLTQTLNGLSKMDVSNLTSGVYFIQDSKSGKGIKYTKE